MIKDTDYINAIARVRFKETKMLNENDIESLILAKDIEECIKLLSDKGFGVTDQEEYNVDTNMSEMIKVEMRKLYRFIKSACPEPFELRFLLYENDFHNIKAQIKSIYYDFDVNKLLLPEGNISIEEIKQIAINMDFSNLPDFCRETALRSNEILKKTRDGQLFDITMDKGCYEAIRNEISKMDNEFLKDLYNIIFALSNIQISIRNSRFSRSKDFLDKILIENDLISKSDLIENTMLGEKNLIEYLLSTCFGDMIKESMNKSINIDMLNQKEIFKFLDRFKYKSTGLEPIVLYVFNKKREIKSVRMILNLKRNLFSPEEIRSMI